MDTTTQAIGCYALALTVAALIIFALLNPGRPSDALIGYDCGPNNEVMVAAEEDHFPACGRIERNPAYD